MERIFSETEMLPKESSPNLSKQPEREEKSTFLPAHSPLIKGEQPTPMAFGTYIITGSLLGLCLQSKRVKSEAKSDALHMYKKLLFAREFVRKMPISKQAK